MNRMRSRLGFVCVFAVLLAMGCNSDRHGRSAASTAEGEGTSKAAGKSSLTIKGSDTMVILAQKWAEAFMKENDGTVVQVSGGGSGTGIAALINGTTDIANASRAMKDTEKTQVKKRQGKAPTEIPVALDALAVYVHKGSPIEALTLEQLKKLYRGEVKSWSELGGADVPVLLYGRENNSGTYAYFKEHVLDDQDFAQVTQTLPGTAAVINAVSKDAGGIGYGGIGYAEGVRAIAVAGKDGKAIKPSLENATSERYPLARYLYVYTVGAPEGLVKRYVDFVLGATGQGVVEGAGYYPLPKDKNAEASREPVADGQRLALLH